jgi:plastocyanin
MKRGLLVLGILAVLLLVACQPAQDTGIAVDVPDDVADVPTPPVPEIEPVEEVVVLEDKLAETETDVVTTIVNITSSGFNRGITEIMAGESITFVNKDTRKHWPASNVHPSHKFYPGSSITKCGTDEADEIFDACRGLDSGEEYSFIFTEVGSWEYHDHLNPRFSGSIVVR